MVVGSLFERRAAGLYHNTAVVWDADGTLCGLYRKMHIPDDPLYYEKFYFTPGDLGFRSFATRVGRIGVCVCWDQWFPEAARLTALRARKSCSTPPPSAGCRRRRTTYGASQHAAWETMMRSHAIANGVFVAAPNRVGPEGALQFWGASFVADPYGNVLARASHDDEEMLVVECDLGLVDTARTHWPFLRDRRIDAYGELTRRYILSEVGNELRAVNENSHVNSRREFLRPWGWIGLPERGVLYACWAGRTRAQTYRIQFSRARAYPYGWCCDRENRILYV